MAFVEMRKAKLQWLNKSNRCASFQAGLVGHALLHCQNTTFLFFVLFILKFWSYLNSILFFSLNLYNICFKLECLLFLLIFLRELQQVLTHTIETGLK
jgi:hypothetical protein